MTQLHRQLFVSGTTAPWLTFSWLSRSLAITGAVAPAPARLYRQLAINGRVVDWHPLFRLHRQLQLTGSIDWLQQSIHRSIVINGGLPLPGAGLDITTSQDEVRLAIKMASYGYPQTPIATPAIAPVVKQVTIPGGGMDAGYTYEYKYSIMSWVGETELSPASSTTVVTADIAVLLTIPVPVGIEETAFRVYRRINAEPFQYIGTTTNELCDTNLPLLYDAPASNTTIPAMSILRSYDNVTWAQLMTGVTVETKFIDYPDFDAYYSARVAYRIFDHAGEPTTATVDTFYGPISFPVSPTKVWSGVGLPSTDLALQGLVTDGSEIKCSFSSGITYLANGEGWWVGDGSSYILYHIDGVGSNYTVTDGVCTAEMPANMLDGHWPIVLTYSSTPLTVVPTQPEAWGLTCFQTEDTPDLRVAHPVVFLQRVSNPGEALVYSDWDTQAQVQYDFTLALNEFLVNFEDRTITFSIPDNINNLQLSWGRASTIESAPINYPLSRQAQNYVVLANKDWQRASILVAEFPRDEVIRNSVATPLLVYVTDVDGAPVEGVTVETFMRTAATEEYEVCAATSTTDVAGMAIPMITFDSLLAGSSGLIKVTATQTDPDNILNIVATIVTFVYCEIG